MPTGKQAEHQRTITISIGKDLVSKIDKLAEADTRSRSQWIVHELTQVVKEYEEEEARAQAASQSAREAFARKPSTPSRHSLNETPAEPSQIDSSKPPNSNNHA